MLSLLDIKHVWVTDYTGWKNRGGGDACAEQRSDERVWNFYRKYAGGGGVKREPGLTTSAFAVY